MCDVWQCCPCWCCCCVTKSLNVSKYVIRNWELASTDPEEIKENVPSILDVQHCIQGNIMEVKTNIFKREFDI